MTTAKLERVEEMLLEERWLLGALFLSLDLTAPFFRDLWVPMEDVGGFQVGLRKFLKPLLSQQPYYEERSALGYLVVEWFHRTYGPDTFRQLSRWIRSVLVLEGPDRLAETLWTSISFRLPPSVEDDFLVPEWISDLMTAVKLDYKTRNQVLDDKMDGAEDQEPTEWDRRLLAIQDSSEDAVVTKTSLIAGYNIFLAVWERHCSKLKYAQLYELWNAGKRAALVLGMDDLEVPFPGGWRFESTDLLNKFAT